MSCTKFCSSGVTFDDYRKVLSENHKLIKDIVLENLSESEILEVYWKKTGKSEKQEENDATFREEMYSCTNTRTIAEEIINNISTSQHRDEFSKIAKVLSGAMKAEQHTVYVPIENESELAIYKDGELTICGGVGKGRTVAAHAVCERNSVLVDNLSMDPRFPRGVHPNEITNCSVLCIPVITPSGDTVVALEFIRRRSLVNLPFSQAELQYAHSVICWMSACIYQSNINRTIHTQQELNDFLLETTKEIFDEMTSVDTVVQKIMTFTKDLVKADRCSLFLVDEERKELYADYFDVGTSNQEGDPLFEKKSQIRFDISRGIAGHVAKTGKVLNIYNAYADSRFNADIDKATGYRTRNILCMPIMSKDKVIGVVQMINSLSGDHFTHADEDAFKMFAVYCALAIQYSIVYRMLKQQQNQYKVAVEMLMYHTVCHEEEVQPLVKKPYLAVANMPKDFRLFKFCGYGYDNVLPQLFLHMIKDMFGPDQFEMEKMCRFVLTVRKNYRPVTYHNWMHGFHVAHCLWVIIRNSPGMLTDFEKMALIIGGLSHDIDHRGYNNAFFTKLELPLANLYSTSVMEQHHYRQAVTILQQDGSDIFSFLTPNEYKAMLELIRHHILATDLALYFGTQKNVSASLDKGEFRLTNSDQRMQAQSLMMTAADLCSISKPWKTQMQTVDKIYEEFYMQGDEEKKHGLKPLPMMDRDFVKEKPKQQVGFINFIALPLYQTLSRALPQTKPLLDGCLDNKDNWTRLANELEK